MNAIRLRPKDGRGRPSKLTPMGEIELLAWWKAKEALGTVRQKAAELGISRPALHGHIDRLLKREIV